MSLLWDSIFPALIDSKKQSLINFAFVGHVHITYYNIFQKRLTIEHQLEVPARKMCLASLGVLKFYELYDTNFSINFSTGLGFRDM